jgi:circadian clock protein KaiC
MPDTRLKNNVKSHGIKSKNKKPDVPAVGVLKCPTGIRGLDEITQGGLPRGRPTLVCGDAGCGKTVLGMEFLIRGITDYAEPGVCFSFEETTEELADNVSSLGLGLGQFIERKQLVVDHISLERSLMEETGEYDLEALFIRLGHAVDSIGAKRVLFDSIEALFAGFEDESILRSELQRLLRWFKKRGLTAVVTAERGQGRLTRHGVEEYVSDCVILLDHRVHDTILTRRMRVVKYRGSMHGTNEFPFLIEKDGISVLPVTSADLQHAASIERVPTGVPALDRMLGGKGYYRAGSVLISGTAGTGKTSLAAHFVDAACARGEKAIYLSFEESPQQIIRDMKSIGIDLGHWSQKGLLYFRSSRPTTFGLEMHLVEIHKMIEDIKPAVMVVDPITALLNSGTVSEARSTVLRLVDFLKEKQITAFMTTLTSDSPGAERTEVNISSLVDTWLLVRNIESGGERNRGLYILKARGIGHSNQVREFLLTDHGVALREVYLGDAGFLTGSARVSQEARDASAAMLSSQEIERKQLLLRRKKVMLDAQVAALNLELETDELEYRQLVGHNELNTKKVDRDRNAMAMSRGLQPVVMRKAAAAGAGTQAEKK